MKRCIRVAWLLLLAWALAACGGGGRGAVDVRLGADVVAEASAGANTGSGADTDAGHAKGLNKPIAGTPHLTLKVAPSFFALSVNEGSQKEIRLRTEDFTRSSQPVYLSIAPLDPAFDPTPSVVALGGGRYSVVLRTAASLAVGDYAGVVILRMCREMPCASAIHGSTVAVPYKIRVQVPATGMPDWQTHQGNAGHTGYVPVALNPARFAYAWEWQSGPYRKINPVVTEGGRVFVTHDDYWGPYKTLYALNELDGSVAWQREFVNLPSLNPPAVANGVVYAATTGYEDTFLWAFRAADGTPVFKTAFPAQTPLELAPTIKDGRVFSGGGAPGGSVYGFAASSGARLWSQSSGGYDMNTPALDSHYAYHYSGSSLEVYSVATGAPVAVIPDPQEPSSVYSYHGSPVLGSDDNVIAFGGGGFSGMASSSTEQYQSRTLTNFSLHDQAVRWRSNKAYLTAPAVANGVVYAGRNNPASLDAMDERTGQVLWSWAGPSADTEFHRNVLVTNNLVFVSTDQAVHAIDLNTHQSVWSYPVPGLLALSADGTLYIVEGARWSTGRLIAIRLN